LAAKYNCRCCNSLSELLAVPEIEAVTVATPSGAHLDVVCEAAKAGKHILCEKPLEISVERVDAMIKCCRENNVILSSIFQTRFYRAVQVIKKAFDAGRFGKMVLSSMQMRWFRNEDYFAKSSWHGTWRMDGGGVLMNQAVHSLDMMLYLNGAPAEVFAFAGTLSHDIEVEDNLCAAIKYRNGSMGTIEVSTSCQPGFPRRAEFSGTKGSVTIEEDTITRWEFVDALPEDDDIRREFCRAADAKGGSSPANVDVDGHAVQISALAAAIRGGSVVEMDGSEGRKAVELVCGIYESVRSGKPYRF
jgi:predicted dehydrogenase